MGRYRKKANEEKTRNAERIAKIQKVADLSESREGLEDVSENGGDDSDNGFHLDGKDESACSDALNGWKYDGDYAEASFAYEEAEDDAAADAETGRQEAELYDFTGVAEVVPDKETVKKKCAWFFGNYFGYSKKSFLNKSREEQGHLIFIKMMEARFPIGCHKEVRKALASSKDALECFDLYKLICENPTNGELASFLSRVQAKYKTNKGDMQL